MVNGYRHTRVIGTRAAGASVTSDKITPTGRERIEKRGMTDQEHLQQLIIARHPCVAVATHDEHYMLSVIRQLAVERGMEMWLWSVTLGWRDGLLADSPPVAETEHPAAAMYYIAHLPPKARIYVTLDLVGHLKDERTLRTMREALQKVDAFGGSLILLDATEDLPPALAAVATRFEVSFPDES